MHRLGHNIMRLATEKGWTLPKLAIESDVNKGNLYRIVDTGTGYSSKSLEKIRAALDTTLGEMFAERAPTPGVPEGFWRVPLIGAVHAGAFASVNPVLPENEAGDTFITSVPVSTRAFAMPVEGDSMVPELLPGSVVVVDPATTPKPGNYVVAEDESGEATLKIYAPRGRDAKGRDIFELVPANPFYPTLRSDQQQVTIVGVVREHSSPDPIARQR